jgi:hypothetical protein
MTLRREFFTKMTDELIGDYGRMIQDRVDSMTEAIGDIISVMDETGEDGSVREFLIAYEDMDAEVLIRSNLGQK